MAESERASMKRLTHVAIAALLVFSACVLLAQLPSDYSWLANHNRIPGYGLVVDYQLTNEAENYTDGAAQQLCKNWAPGALASYPAQRGSTNGSDTNDPTVGPTGWTFDGIDDRGLVSVPVVTGPSVTVAAVASCPWQTAAYRRILAIRNNNTLVGFSLFLTGFAELDWSVKMLGIYGNGYSSAREPRAFGPYGSIANGTHHTIIGILSSGQARIYLDGVRVETVSTSGSVPILSGNTQIGSVYSGSTYYQFWSGTMSRILVYDRDLGVNEVASVNRTLKRWAAQRGISLP